METLRAFEEKARPRFQHCTNAVGRNLKVQIYILEENLVIFHLKSNLTSNS